MLLTLNRQLEKVMPIITPLGVVVGVLFAVYLKNFAYLIPWIFAFMTFSGSLSLNVHSLKRVVANPLPVIIALFVLHFIMPLWAWGIGAIAFHDDVFTITGIILGMAIPTGITSFIWVSIYRGNIALTLSIILIDTLLAPFIVPYTLSLIVGEKIDMDIWSMMKGLLGMIVIPSLIGLFLNQWTKGKVKEVFGPKLAPFSKIGIGIVVMINSAVVAPYLKKIDMKLMSIALVVFFVAFTGYLLAFVLGKLFRQDKGTLLALTFTGGMRNISAGAVLAVAYFPPPVAVPVVVGMLFQQILASLYGVGLRKYFDKMESGERRTA
ncbi:bile acid:sodium symporter family protein [Bacillus timonensis]|nr:bile acid:sodium symporter family protein [Bacillus timonensis]